MSPYDVPQQIRGFREKDTDFFIIEFQYLLNDERTRTEKPSADIPIEMEIGNNSNRIYRIKIDVVKSGFDAVRLEIEPVTRNVVGAIKAFSSKFSENFRERYRLNEKLVLNHRDALLSSLAAG